MWLRESPAISGCKTAALQLAEEDNVHELEGFFYRCSGVSVRLIGDKVHAPHAASTWRR